MNNVYVIYVKMMFALSLIKYFNGIVYITYVYIYFAKVSAWPSINVKKIDFNEV